MTIIIQAVEEGGRSVRRNFPAIEFAEKKSPDLAFSNVDRYAPNATLNLKKHWRRVIMFLYAMKRVVDFTERTKDHFVLCRNMPSFLP